jgi:long-subunit acyl-CoA synthetase (AMP-forming)
VFADSESPNLIAVVLPKNPQDPSARSRIQQFVDARNDRRSSLIVDRIVFTDLAFSRENGFLRPNLKLDRKKIAEHFVGVDTGLTFARSA